MIPGITWTPFPSSLNFTKHQFPITLHIQRGFNHVCCAPSPFCSTVPIPMYYEHLLLFKKLETGQNGAITQNIT
jgi:hypothetical protein